MTITLGETVSETFIGSIGETITWSSSYINGVPAFWEPVFVDLANGFWHYSYTPGVAGFYEWAGNGSSSGPVAINFDVEGAPVVAPPTGGTGAATLASLVREVAQRSQDLIMGVTTDTGSDLKTMTDVLNLTEDHHFFEGMELYFTSGANQGSLHRVIDSDGDLAVLTFVPDVGIPVSAGTSYELYNRRGNGHRRWEYIQAINNAIREGGSNAAKRIVVDVPTVVTSTTPYLVVPDGIGWVCRVLYQDWNGQWQELRRNSRNGWSYDHNGIITLNGGGLAVADSRLLRLRGYVSHSTLTLDTDATDLDVEWIVETAAGILQNSNPDNYGNMAPGQYMRNRADAIRGKLATVMDSGCVKV
jgi:hypothetical protein